MKTVAYPKKTASRNNGLALAKTNGTATTQAETLPAIPPMYHDWDWEEWKKVKASFEQARGEGKNLIDMAERMRQRLGIERLHPEVEREVSEWCANEPMIKAEIKISPHTYGDLCAAAAALGLSDWKAALEAYVERTVLDWGNEGYFLDSIEPRTK